MGTSTRARCPRRVDRPRTWPFFALACALTWSFAAPTALAWLARETPSPGALAGAGLSAFGPLIAAFVFARRERTLRETFGRFRTSPKWIVLALATPLAIRLAATA